MPDPPDELSFDELVAILPHQAISKHSEAVLKYWFNLADTDGDGRLTLDDFLSWALMSVTRNSKPPRSAVSPTLAKYDLDSSGTLDTLEFFMAVEELGLSESGRAIVAALPKQPDGTIAHDALLSNATSPDATWKNSSLEMKLFLTALALDCDPGIIDTTDWTFEGNDPESTRQSIIELVSKRNVPLTALFAQFFDDGGSHLINQTTFMKVMKEDFGFRGSDTTLKHIWVTLDGDDSGTVSFGELNSWVHGTRSAPQATRAGRADGGGGEYWSEDWLRHKVNAILEKDGVRAADVVKLWRSSRDGKISLKDLLVNVHSMVKNDMAWYSDVRGAVSAAFNAIDSERVGALSKEEITCWLEGLPAPTPAPQKPFSPSVSSKGPPGVQEMAHQMRSISPTLSQQTKTYWPSPSASVFAVPTEGAPPERPPSFRPSRPHHPPSAAQRWARRAGGKSEERSIWLIGSPRILRGRESKEPQPYYPVAGVRTKSTSQPDSPPALISAKSFVRTKLAVLSLGIYDGRPLTPGIYDGRCSAALTREQLLPGVLNLKRNSACEQSQSYSARSHLYPAGHSFTRTLKGRYAYGVGAPYPISTAGEPKGHGSATIYVGQWPKGGYVTLRPKSAQGPRPPDVESGSRRSISEIEPKRERAAPSAAPAAHDGAQSARLRCMCDSLGEERQFWRDGLHNLRLEQKEYMAPLPSSAPHTGPWPIIHGTAHHWSTFPGAKQHVQTHGVAVH
jgi:Ca2+-binding EF-hand superfamily protein